MTRLYIITLFILLIYRVHHAKYGLDESQSGIKTARSINRLGYEDDTTLVAEIEEELKNLLMRVKEESEKASLKLNSQKTNHAIWSHHFMANRRRNSGDSDRFYFLGLQNYCGW